MRNCRRFQTPEFTAYLGNDIQTEVKFGFVVSKSLGGAVSRNRVKRQLRAISSQLLTQVKPVSIVIRTHPAATKASFDQLRASLNQALSSVMN
jgi:ribonuclease P protein component